MEGAIIDQAKEILERCDEALREGNIKKFKKIIHHETKLHRPKYPKSDSRLEYKNGEIEACPLSERLRFTDQDMIEMVGKVYATALVGPVLLGAVGSVAAWGPIVELSELIMEIHDQIPSNVRDHVKDLLEVAKKSKADYEQLMEDLELLKNLITPSVQDVYPKAGCYYRICNRKSGKYLHETGGLPLLRYKVDMSSSAGNRSGGCIWGLVVTNRPGVFVFESARHPGRFIKIAGGSRSENAILTTSEDPDHRGCQFKLTLCEDDDDDEDDPYYYNLKSCHSGKVVMPFACMNNTYLVQGNNADMECSQWSFENV